MNGLSIFLESDLFYSKCSVQGTKSLIFEAEHIFTSTCLKMGCQMSWYRGFDGKVLTSKLTCYEYVNYMTPNEIGIMEPALK